MGQRVAVACRIRANPDCDDVTWTFADGDDVHHDLHNDSNIRISYKVQYASRTNAPRTPRHVITELTRQSVIADFASGCAI